ncbi:hypothetical protein CYMTET_8388 [Cymbomonas tetramitiformis]|uniref:C2H2-type domain-containing protein n=1 Tax=Cymbomonas tetramitiformis TaxID=36881 RepID=A0AAE0GTL1_9CHLO|nr:hypothetical protein CYMTET_8388 [Cymbomonas tetramitiformis]|eukprot:gene11541-13637_t
MDKTDAAAVPSLFGAAASGADVVESDDANLATGIFLSEQEAYAQQLLDPPSSRHTSRGGAWRCDFCTCMTTVFCTLCSTCKAFPSARETFGFPLPDFSFGVEFELFMPSSVGWCLQDVARCMNEAGIVCKFEGYTHQVTTHWKIVTDTSIHADSHCDLTFELVSPILKGEQGILRVHELLEAVKKIGVEVNESTGFHVHVDGTNLTTEDLRRICANFLKYEGAFDCMMKSSRRGAQSSFAKSNRLALGTLSCKQRNVRVFAAESKEALVKLVNPEQDRYYKFNLQPLSRPSPTIEFRQHHGTFDPGAALAWIRTLLHFTYSSILQPRGVHFPEERAAEEELLCFFNEVVHDPLLFNFYLEGVGHFGVEHLDNRPWRCSVPYCEKAFSASRDLMQHVRDSHTKRKRR